MNKITIITDDELINNPEYFNILKLFINDQSKLNEIKKSNEIEDLYSYNPNLIKINELRVSIPFVTLELKNNNDVTFVAVLPEYIKGKRLHEISTINGLKIKKILYHFLSENFNNYFDSISNNLKDLETIQNGIAFRGNESTFTIFKYK